ncbi:hypothetical protein Acr_00g0019070 [Actinidia rufa]|uniref:Uncharacterized protein n=1 Tax=Actinidia rufa TaxID=165716 RepID=A0A7J0DC94_9ERIC|nr:hypothetical protein Acr_00g0019070 [Actinidia rufa]
MILHLDSLEQAPSLLPYRGKEVQQLCCQCCLTWSFVQAPNHITSLIHSTHNPLNPKRADAHKSVVYAFEHMEEVFSFDDETHMHASLQSWKAHLTGYGHDHAEPSTSAHDNELFPLDDETSMHASLQLFNASLTGYGYDHAQPSTRVHNNEIFVDYPNSCNFETSPFNNGHVQPSSDSLGINSFLPSFGTSNDLNAHGLQDTTSFSADEHLQFFATDNSHQYQNSNSEWGGDLNSFVSGFLLSCAVRKAQIRWKKLFSVLQWYSVRKIVALKSVSSETIHTAKRARIY